MEADRMENDPYNTGAFGPDDDTDAEDAEMKDDWDDEDRQSDDDYLTDDTENGGKDGGRRRSETTAVLPPVSCPAKTYLFAYALVGITIGAGAACLRLVVVTIIEDKEIAKVGIKGRVLHHGGVLAAAADASLGPEMCGEGGTPEDAGVLKGVHRWCYEWHFGR
ncbi:hypothetical protein QBC39DRAFT_328382 [Podospora conica]|nr:hypothetical protein QBC39DRAFT_328382 [Schizothecium conicum]